MPVQTFLGIPFEGWLVIFTGVLAASTIFLWVETKKNAKLAKEAFTLSFLINFISLIKETPTNFEPTDFKPARQHIMNKIYHLKGLREIMQQLFPEYSEKFKEVFGLDDNFEIKVKEIPIDKNRSRY
ncbi:MAG: hypothetical protein J7K23_01325 [Thermoproteales archaeon]|nr:hypothetical protein [Thermoproteales archaeon]